MFEHYQLGDLFANMRKQFKIAIAIFIVVSASLSFALLRNINQQQMVSSVNHSLDLIYQIEAPAGDTLTLENGSRVGGYSDFYYYLIDHNVNGAFLFNDVDDATMEIISRELGMNRKVLLSSDRDLWEHKIIIAALAQNAGVSVKVLTSSPTFNQLFEQKMDLIMTEYSSVYPKIKVNKLDSIESYDQKAEAVVEKTSIKTIAIRSIAAVIGGVVVTMFLFVARYLFRPTINRTGDFDSQAVQFVYVYDTLVNVTRVIEAQVGIQSVVFVSSSDKILASFQQRMREQYEDKYFVFSNDIGTISNNHSVILLEAYGVTTHQQFEKRCQQLQAMKLTPVGIIALPLEEKLS